MILSRYYRDPVDGPELVSEQEVWNTLDELLDRYGVGDESPYVDPSLPGEFGAVTWYGPLGVIIRSA